MARKPKLDTILADAVDTARGALAAIAGAQEIGEHLGVTAEGERLVTHRFVSQKKGYQGWTWFATLARVPRAKAKDLTVCEVGIIAGDDSLLAPAWVPWADRLAKEEIEAASAAQAAEDAGESATDPSQAEGSEPEEGADDAAAEPSASAEQESGESEEDDSEAAPHKSPARRQVRRRRTAQRTAARRRAAQRNRTCKEN
ncbi:DUF3027 domain-containing protein [Glutamicibacter sp. JL.03c]|uniref:DUF3027 domain-containing protein n=1 Tax=Glutamicibacter sp. JL.03c TaxID=2984842 RepID=UPI0021F70F6F|nr:DUF3027 domain-containing protein [Glutamicibacter sp. JL.03c]UYQ78122.1 DUF3027 domain-containing protein [Glutamicibacter sp. JL.03c]